MSFIMLFVPRSSVYPFTGQARLFTAAAIGKGTPAPCFYGRFRNSCFRKNW
ncbi:hypothetical protein ACE6ED_01300 [Paenibacillus sp. CN-4]|uniref:hypothetical protein n=1 Tax=Paenibacillus nanchangensis TaxID=3348343 RepID=UPI00397B41D5